MKRPILTITISMSCILMTAMAPLFDSSIYGINGHPTLWMSFMPSNPLRLLGLGLITSPFLHINLEHLIVNTFFLVPIAMIIERKYSSLYLLKLFFSLHALVLLQLVLVDTFFQLNGKSFLGCSHIVIGIYSYYFTHEKKFGLLAIPFTVILLGAWQGQGVLTTLAHTLGLASGVCAVYLNIFFNSLRSNRPN